MTRIRRAYSILLPFFTEDLIKARIAFTIKSPEEMEQELLYESEKKTKFTEPLKKRISSEFVPTCREEGKKEEISVTMMRFFEDVTSQFPTPPSHIPQHRLPTNEQTPTSTYSTAMKATSSYFGNLRQAMTDRVSGISMGKR